MLIKKTSRKASEGGFSFVELLLVMSLAPIIFFAVYSNFTSGVRLWQRMQIGTPEEDQAIFRLKTQRDFQNVLHYAAVPFEGEKEEMFFMAGIDVEGSPGGKRAMGQVHYYYDESARTIARETRDFSQLYQEKPGQITLMAQNVRSVQMAYLVKDPLENDFTWKEEFTAEKAGDLPLAIRLIYTAQNSSQSTELTFFIPAGGSLK